MNEIDLFFELGLQEITQQRIQAYGDMNGKSLIQSIDSIVKEWANFKDKGASEDSESILNDARLLNELNFLSEQSCDLQINIDDLRDRVLTRALESNIDTNNNQGEEE